MAPRKSIKLSGDLAIDMGTANTRIYVKGEGVVLDQPSVVALTRDKGRTKIVEAGHLAAEMIGRVPTGLEIAWPMRGGVIDDLEIAGEMLRLFLRLTRKPRLGGAKAVLVTPSGSTPVERRLLTEAASIAGVARATLIEAPLAAALGAGLPATGPDAALVVDVGAGITDVAVLALGGTVYARAADIGGEAMDEAICAHIRATHNVVIGPATAERVKCEIGSAYRPEADDGRTIVLHGRDLGGGLPRDFNFSEAETAQSLIDPVTQIYEGIKLALAGPAADLAPAIAAHGILLTGGGARLRNLDLVIAKASGITVMIPREPMACAVIGAGVAMESRTELLAVND